ncbi:MAG: sulfatase-like hydrolase/transferase [Alphaproteobacteria bacterium]|nr:sulfatase-like hydrolase/transferase [Alphaproteobacteria bacterium]
MLAKIRKNTSQICKKILQNKYTVFMLILSLIEIICLFLNPYIKIKYTIISSSTLVFLSLFSPGWIFSIFYFFTGMILLFDWHFVHLYGAPFKSMAQQILAVTFDTNIMEMASYINLLSPFELTIFFILAFLFIIMLFIKFKKRGWFIYFLIMLFSLWTGAGKPYIKEISKYISQSHDYGKQIKEKNNFKWGAVSSQNSPQNVIIFIGESQRYDYFEKVWHNFMGNNIILMSDAISQYAYTLWAMPQILSRKTVNEKKPLFYESSIFKLFEEAGYETYFISYLKKLHVGDDNINFITIESQNFSQYGSGRKDYVPIKYPDGTPDDFVNDAEIIPLVDNILRKDDKKKLVVIKIIGCHYNFEDRYPNSFDKHKPSLKQNHLPLKNENKEIILKTYENAMEYSVYVIQEFLKTINKIPSSTFLVFSSDHAINIFDNGKWMVANVPQSFHIPIFWYANDAYLNTEENRIMWNKLSKQKDKPVISNYIPETITRLASIHHDHYNPKMDILEDDEKFKQKRMVIWTDLSEHFYEDME